MRLAVLVSIISGGSFNDVSDATSDASGVHSAGQRASMEYLEGLGFAIVTIAERRDVELRFIEAISGVTSGDHVLVHVSGHLDEGGSIRSEAGNGFSLAALGAAASAREPDGLVMWIEASCEHDADDPFGTATRVDELRQTLDAATGGRSALIALRDADGPDDPFEFTRLALRIAEELRMKTDTNVSLSQIVDELRVRPESPHVARSFSFSRGTSDFELTTAALHDGHPRWEPLVALAKFAAGHSKWDWALEAYRAARLVCADGAHGPNGQEALASIHEGIGALEQARGRWGAARTAYMEARARFPGSIGAREGLTAIARTLEDWSSVVVLERERAAAMDDGSARAELLFATARVAALKAHNVALAIAILEDATNCDASREDIQRALARARRVQGRRLRESGERTIPAGERAGGDVPLDIELDESDIIEAADPILPSLAEPVPPPPLSLPDVEVLSADEPEEPTATLWEPQPAESLSATMRRTDPDVASEVPVILASEISGLDRTSDPGPAPARTLASIDRDLAERPHDPGLLFELFDAARNSGDDDRAFLAATALAEIGRATDVQRSFAERNRPDGLRVKSPMTPALWNAVRPTTMGTLLDALFAAIGPAAIDLRHQQRRANGKTIQLDPQHRASPTSTASAVRCFHWAARVLGVSCPALYVLDNVPGDIAAVPAEEPTTALGPGAVRGLSTKTLAFVAGRHLTYYRPEFSVLVHFPSLEELSALIFAVFDLGGQTRRIPPANALGAAALARNIERNLSITDRARAAICAERLGAVEGGFDARALSAWARDVELLASRVGLLIAGDLDSVLSHVRRESRPIAGLTFEDRRGDLVGFFASSAHAAARKEIVEENSPSSIPPSVSADRGRENIAV